MLRGEWFCGWIGESNGAGDDCGLDVDVGWIFVLMAWKVLGIEAPDDGVSGFVGCMIWVFFALLAGEASCQKQRMRSMFL